MEGILINGIRQVYGIGTNDSSSVSSLGDEDSEFTINLDELRGNKTRNESFPQSTTDYIPYHERPETYIVPVLFAIIFIIGVLGNGTLILIFLKHRTMRNVPNMYICSLAVGDILVIFFCVPFTSTVYTVESWPYGPLVCKFSEFIKDVSIGVSVFTLTALSADRYFAIVDPMRKLTGRRATRFTCLTIAGIWVLSIVFAMPSLMYSYVRVFQSNTTSPVFLVCYPFPEEFGEIYRKVVVLFKALAYYVVPLTFIAFFYIIMAHHLVLSTVNMPGEAHGQGRQIQARKKVAKMVLSFVVIFAICFFPSQVFLLWFYFDPNSEENFNSFWNVLRIVGFCLGFINSCLNPICLYAVSGTFRKHFNRHLLCCLDKGAPRRRNVRSNGCCPRISRREHRPSFRHTSYNSDAGDRNGLRRASTLTSTVSVRTKVTWDTGRKGSSSNLLNVNTSLNRNSPIKETTYHLYQNPTAAAMRNVTELHSSPKAVKSPAGIPEDYMMMTSFIQPADRSSPAIENLN